MECFLYLYFNLLPLALSYGFKKTVHYHLTEALLFHILVPSRGKYLDSYGVLQNFNTMSYAAWNSPGISRFHFKSLFPDGQNNFT